MTGHDPISGLMIKVANALSFKFALPWCLTMYSVTKYYLGFGPVENGYVYAITGGFSTLGYVSLVFILRFFKERTILLFGLSVELFISLLLLALMGIVTFRAAWFIPVGVIGLILFSSVLSYIMASSSSILAKSSLPEHQSIIQGGCSVEQGSHFRENGAILVNSLAIVGNKNYQRLFLAFF